MVVTRRLIAYGLLAISAFISSLLIGCSAEAAPMPLEPVVPQPPTSHFTLGPFYGFDSLRHYEYANSTYDINPIPPGGRNPDSTGHIRIISATGYLVNVSAPGPDTIRLEIGTISRTEDIDARVSPYQPDTTYDTSYASYSYLRNGMVFVKLGNADPPLPFLDRAYVTDKDTSSPEIFKGSLTIKNLSAALRGEPAEYTHVFSSGYAGGGSAYSFAGTYRQGVGLTDCSGGSGFSGSGITLVDAKP